ncbi:glycosyltransferase family 25 protein [Methylobacterium sp. BTF04]|uniref:glycosyltransferase family 25 protein n=1 Tax=Methylobacterium sp. BTF04 TaxID=2708300 RepID=UPI0013D1B642|nr:glycosyltransferase family 25 protein [Methylobacterium sp. BTF04]NEU13485.1 glycosyltransferase family 25 protein [Methylobacterium sp. BTF04]
MLERFGSVVVVNLRDRTDRRRETQRELTRIGHAHTATFFDAIRPSIPAGFGSPGEYGCYLSHLAVWRAAVDTGSVLVLEDDIAFAPDFTERSGLIDALPPDWDVFYAGHMQLPELKRTWSDTGLVRIDSSVEFIGLHCYGISARALPALVAAAEEFLSRPHGHPAGGRMPVDGALNIARRQLGLTTYAAMPPLAHQRASRTDIGRLKWFDRAAAFTGPIGTARRLKNELRRTGRAIRHALDHVRG